MALTIAKSRALRRAGSEEGVDSRVLALGIKFSISGNGSAAKSGVGSASTGADAFLANSAAVLLRVLGAIFKGGKREKLEVLLEV